MLPVYDYTDHRRYLKDYFEEKKKQCPFFSYNYFALKAGFNNKGFMYNIIHGSKKLSARNAAKLCAALGLDKKERDYFQLLVSFNQAERPFEKDHAFTRMEEIRKPPKKPDVWFARKDQYEYYSQWRHGAVRALVGMHPDRKKPAWFARRLHPAISPGEARESLKLLLRLEFIRRNSEGAYSLSNKTISSGKEIRGVALCNFYLQHLKLAAEAVKGLPGDCRRFEGITLGISRKSYERISAKYEAFIEKALSIAEEDTEADMVYQLMLQLYPLTKTPCKKENKNEQRNQP